MDGSERVPPATQKEAEEEFQEVVEEGEAEEMVTEEAPTVTYNISQPQVIVERVVPENVIVEEVAVTAPPQQNGAATDDGAAPATAATASILNDIIADAVAEEGEEEGQQAATTAAEGEEEGQEEEEDDEEGENSKESKEAAAGEKDDDTPATRVKQEQSLDLNQCRCCTSRDDLQDIFEPLKRDASLPLSSIIVKLCPGVTITKRDHLPNVICKGCVYKAEIAWEFREQCVKTDGELRKSLPRAKNKTRKRTDYTLIDYESSSGEDAGGNVDDEDEFKLSDELEEGTEPSDSDRDSEEEKPRKRGRPRKHPIKTPAKSSATPASAKLTPAGTPRGRGRPPKNPKVTPVAAAPKMKSPRAAFEYVEAKVSDDDEEDDDDLVEEVDVVESPKKVIKRQCPKCKMVLAPRGPHTCRLVSFACSFCGEKFATHPLYANHQQLHNNFQNANTCVRCHKQFPTKMDLRKHQSGVRCHKALKNNCTKCGRVLLSASQLALHLRTKCQPPAKAGAVVVTPKKELFTPKREKNLFKFVAPPTSTYWSDSASD